MNHHTEEFDRKTESGGTDFRGGDRCRSSVGDAAAPGVNSELSVGAAVISVGDTVEIVSRMLMVDGKVWEPGCVMAVEAIIECGVGLRYRLRCGNKVIPYVRRCMFELRK